MGRQIGASMMRWKYLIPRFVLVLLVWAFFTFAFDPMLRYAVVSGGQTAFGAKVDVANLTSGFFPPSVLIKNVRVANQSQPGTNLIEFESMRMRVAGDPLLRRIYVIEEGTITGLRWGTPRDDDGRLPESETPDESDGPGLFDGMSDKVAEISKKLADDMLDRIKGELDPRQLETVRHAEELNQKWDGRFNELKMRSANLKDRIDTIKNTVTKTKGNALERIEAYAHAAEEAEMLKEELKRLRGELPMLVDDARGDMKSLDESRQRDIQGAKDKLQLLKEFDGDMLTQELLGEGLQAQLDESLEWATWIREKLATVTVSTEPERSRGRDIAFDCGTKLPKLLVKRLNVSGECDLGGDPTAFAGTITGLTSNPRVYGRPVVVRMTASGTANILVEAVLDHTGDNPIHDVYVTYTLPEGSGPDATGLVCTAKLRFAGDTVVGKVDFHQEPLTIPVDSIAASNPRVKLALASVLSEIHQLDATIDVSGAIRKPKLKLSSNLGPQIADGVNRFLSSELESRRKELVSKANALVDARVTGFQQMLNDKYGNIVHGLDFNETQIRELVQRVATKNGINVDPRKLKGLFRR